MTRVRVIVASIEEADDGIAEFWCEGELMAVTEISENRLQLRIDARANGRPWLVDTTSLAEGLADAMHQLDTYGTAATPAARAEH